MTHWYRIRKWLPSRHGEPCRIVARGRGPGPRNVLIKFADGLRVVVPRWSVRRSDADAGMLPSPEHRKDRK